MSIVVVSPHFDDAVLSCGDYLAERPGATVLTVFAGAPETELPLTHYDAQCGFKSAPEAMGARLRENLRACVVLECSPLDLDFVDIQYGGKRATANEISEAVEGAVRAITGYESFVSDEDDPPTLLIPLGLVHEDHALAAHGAYLAARRLRCATYAYEDIPYRVQSPGAAVSAVELIRGRGLRPALLEPPRATAHSRALKRAAVHCYRSQLGGLDLDSCFVPERFWRLTWE